jgi:hypothetical protein
MGSAKAGKETIATCSESSLKPWEINGYRAKFEYDAMRSLFACCWACNATRKPMQYYGPWLIERAHIANKPRREDRRLVVMLCTLCHKFQHGERLPGFDRPRLTVGQMLELKRERDPVWYDPEFVQKHSVRRLHSEPVVNWYFEERIRNRGN